MTRKLDTDRVKEFQEQAVANGSWNGQPLYPIMHKLVRYYGVDIVEDAMDFAMGKIISGDRIDGLVSYMYTICKRRYQRKVNSSDQLSATEVHWVATMDLDGLKKAIQDFKTRSGRAEKLVKDWTDEELKQEISFLTVVMHEWDAIKSIDRARYYDQKKRIENSYRKSVANMPLALLRSLHETRVKEAKKARDDADKHQRVSLD